jgi:hypothetical protein
MPSSRSAGSTEGTCSAEAVRLRRRTGARHVRSLRRLSLLLGACLIAGCALDGLAGAGSPEVIPFVDAHVHLNDVAMQIDLMRRYRAERAVVFWGRNSDNESIADSVGRYPDRFIGFASISPERSAYRRQWDSDDTALLKSLDGLLASGRFRGIGEISVTHFPSPGFPETDYDPAGRTMTGILTLARKHGVPVLVHVEWTRIDALSALLSVSRRRRHLGPGGYTPLFVAARMLDRHPNLYYELSARTWPVHPRSPDYTILRDGSRVLAAVAGADRDARESLRRRHRRQPSFDRERCHEVRQRRSRS